jgi:8-hydroxy-5-deazaflavin:NADPH oxidoreductase
VNITVIGTGTLAVALGRAWAEAGHTLRVTGRDRGHAGTAAGRIGPAATAVDPGEAATGADVLVVAVAWEGLEAAVRLVGAGGSLAGRTVVDCTNPVDFATGRLLPVTGSAAELVARSAPGARVVKALNLFAGASWPYRGPGPQAPLVPLCGDDPDALARVGVLVGDLGGRPVVFGDLAASRQVEEAAGFVVRLVATGHNPRLAVPDVEPVRG